ncbi:hypothetical protein K491DRAFT_696018 [Lophiostoma macrostomum CBS 122681]|uniref:Uncharacterized protein n=1 Tax=Lophiostoma macrostomum CBS 122681 TaxID=1314788 RepID=A0A6A6SZK6_9PLEO|nr:hypothetical protein K491DRAFT_696018 [Lophiostoma macrostomum CBS 122681]
MPGLGDDPHGPAQTTVTSCAFTDVVPWSGCTPVVVPVTATDTAPPDNKNTGVVTSDGRPAETDTAHPSQSPSFTGATTVLAATATPSSSSSTSNGVSKGAVAGIAIGTAILGAAIAFLIAFFLFRRRKQNPKMTNSSYESVPQLPSSVGKGIPSSPYVQEVSQIPPPALAAAAVPREQREEEDVDLANLAASSAFLAGVLPEVADDMTIRSRVSELFEQMQRHVENFYRDVHASITPSMESDLAKFGNGSAGTGMLEMLQSFSQPTVAIKHALVSYVMGITAPEGKRGESLFPREVIGMGGKDKVLNANPDLSPAYLLYRQLSSHLYTTLNPLSPHTNPSASALSLTTSLSSRVQEAAEHFALTFFPWANPAYSDSDKDDDLVSIIIHALELMLWLHGQPFVYELNWEGVGRRGIVIAPGLARMTDTQGREDGEPQVLLEPTVVAT